jgi:hypothetical protein
VDLPTAEEVAFGVVVLSFAIVSSKGRCEGRRSGEEKLECFVVGVNRAFIPMRESAGAAD